VYLLLSAVCIVYVYVYVYSTVTFEPLENCSATHAGMTSCLHQLWLHRF